MKNVKVAALILIFIVSVVTGLGHIAGMGVERTVLSQSYYQGLFKETELAYHLNQGMESVMADQILEDMQEDGHEEISDEEAELALQRISFVARSFQRTFEPEWIEEQFLLVVGDVLGLVKGKKDELTAVIDLQERKELLKPNMIEELESLSGEDFAAIDMPQASFAAIADEILMEMDLPEQISLQEILQEEGALPADFEENLSRLQFARTLFLFTPYIIFALLLFLCYRLAGVYGGLKWFGAAALFTGLTALSGLLLLRGIAVAPLVADIAEDMPLEIEVISAAVKYTTARLSTVPAVYAGIGFAFLAGGIFLGKKSSASKAVHNSKV